MNRAGGKALGALTLAMALISGSAAMAGTKAEAEVTIATSKAGTTTASGSLGTARAHSSVAKELSTPDIGCSIEVGATGTLLRCAAQNANGTRYECTTGSAAMIQAATAIGPASWISFTGPAKSTVPQECTALIVDNNSKWKPMVP